MPEIGTIQSDLAAARIAYQEAVVTKPVGECAPLSDRVRELMQLLSETISTGAKACPDCENMPHGMEQPIEVKGQVGISYEVGCLVCLDHRAVGLTPSEAVANWNAGKYLPARG